MSKFKNEYWTQTLINPNFQYYIEKDEFLLRV